MLVVDGDLRAPTQHRVFSLENSDGLTTLLLSDQVPAIRSVQRTVHTNVSVLTSGPIPSNPSELLGSGRMRDVLLELRDQFDLVLIDSPPLLGVTDASVLSALMDSIVLVVRPGRTRTGELRAMVEQVAGSGKPILGVVFNRSRQAGRALRYGRYGDSSEVLPAATAPKREARGGLRPVGDDDRAARG